MKNVIILGAGTAGTMMANHLHKKLDKKDWQITIIDEKKNHYYQPGFLFLPFDLYRPEALVQPIQKFIPHHENFINESIDRIAPEESLVKLANGKTLSYDVLIIATGAHIARGDAAAIPASKAGSVAHFEAEILTKNILHYIHNEPLTEEFDGHANCFIETGNRRALLIDFNYTHEPVTGTFPFPGLGPLGLLEESYMNHLGKVAFKWIYWHMLLKGKHIPFVSARMQESGKEFA